MQVERPRLVSCWAQSGPAVIRAITIGRFGPPLVLFDPGEQEGVVGDDSLLGQVKEAS